MASCQLALLIAATTLVLAQEVKPLQISANDLVRETVARELAAANGEQTPHMFRSRKQTPKGSQTRLYVETKDAMAGMLIAVNDHPLTPEQLQAERDHLNGLANNPEQLKKKHSREKEDADRSLRIVKALPDAFLYEYAGTETGAPGLGKEGDELERLRFTPNPSYSPPSHVEQVLAGMKGYLLIDKKARRIALIDGTLFRDVSFGWGIIGHLDQGGHFRVQQADVGDGTWDLTRMTLNITGKILFFKKISMTSDETYCDFRAVPQNLTFAQGAELLKAEQEKLAHNTVAEPAAAKKDPR